MTIPSHGHWHALHDAARLLATVAAVLAAAAAFGQAPTPAAHTVLQNPSVDELRQALAAPAIATRSFRMTAPPSTNGLCPGAGAAHQAEATAAGGNSRNLVVVPRPGADAPQANLAVQFANDSDALTSTSQQLLDRLAQVLNEPAAANARFAIAGHTDATGPRARNMVLSCARAIAVRRYLVERAGVAPQRLTAYGFGPDEPLQTGVTASEINRRVEVRRAD